MQFIWSRSALSLCILVTGLCFGQSKDAKPSQPPTPAPTKSSQKPQQRPSNKSPEARKDNYVSKTSTPSTDQSNPTIITVEAGNSRQNQESESSTNWWIMVFTGLLVATSILQWWYTKRSADAAKLSADVARDSLVIGERAYVTVDQLNAYLAHGESPIIKYEILNTGRTPAIFVSAQHGFAIAKEIPEIPVYSSISEGPATIASGNKIFIPATPDPDFIFSHDLIPSLKAKDSYVYFWALITYRDVFNKIRHFAFGKVYDMDTCECEVYKSEKYNYSD
jgi:hypothetical protein